MSKRSALPKTDVTPAKIKRTASGDVSKETDENDDTNKTKYTFKNSEFQHSGAIKSGRKWSWKNLKPIAASERSQAPPDGPVYLNIESPPCIKPAKKYSDISGQLAKYTDPETGLYYASVKEYKQIKRLTPDIVQGYLDIRHIVV